MPNALIIEELTGSQRKIELQGRALPFRKTEWKQHQRNTKTLYPGNPSAVFQILGTEFMPTTFTGIWRDRYLGADQAITLVAFMQALNDAGQELRVTWGANARRGILEEFFHGHDDIAKTAGDILWTAVFNWTGKDSDREVSFRTATFNSIDASEKVRGLASALLGIPLPESLNGLAEGILAVQDFMGDIEHAVSQVEKVIETATSLIMLPLETVQRAVTLLERVRGDALGIISTLATIPALSIAIVDDVKSLFDGEIWTRSIRGATGNLAIGSEKERDGFKEQADAEVKTIYITRGEDLRKVSLHFYGTADEWVRIADHNGLKFSNVPAGTKLKIPRIRQ